MNGFEQNWRDLTKPQTVEVRDGALFLNDSQVVMPDVPASNGVIHVIDAVLIP